MNKIVLVVSVLAALCSASPHVSDDKQIKHALLKYNYGIIKMATSGKTEFFKSFVTEEVLIKLMVWVESWQVNNLVMIANINDFRFGPISYGEHNATMTTMENWDFSYVSLLTKEMALAPVNILYKMRYTLEKHDTGWMIVAVEHLDEKEVIRPDRHKPALEPKVQKPSEDAVQPTTPQKIQTH